MRWGRHVALVAVAGDGQGGVQHGFKLVDGFACVLDEALGRGHLTGESVHLLLEQIKGQGVGVVSLRGGLALAGYGPDGDKSGSLRTRALNLVRSAERERTGPRFPIRIRGALKL